MQQVRREVPEATKHELTQYERQGAWYLDGKDEGRVEGRVEALVDALLLLLAGRGLQLDEHQRATIENCDDRDRLRRLFERAVRATSIAEILTEDD